MNPNVQVLLGDCRAVLPTLASESVQCCVTSPPYWGLRKYLFADAAAEIGQEKTPSEYVAALVAVFQEVHRVLRKDGTLFLNLGDTYAGGGNGGGGSFAKDGIRCAEPGTDKNKATRFGSRGAGNGVKSKDLIGIPWLVAFALRQDGWWLRSCCPWLKRNCMPESVKDRPASAMEYVFLLSKSEKSYYDAKAVAVPASESYQNDSRWVSGPTDRNIKEGYEIASARNPKATHKVFNGEKRTTRNRRNSDWFFESWQGLYEEDGDPLAFVVNTKGYRGSHFATFPPKLVEPCIKACSRTGDTILDPFGGSGTVGQVANELDRKSILIELQPDYLPMIRERVGLL